MKELIAFFLLSSLTVLSRTPQSACKVTIARWPQDRVAAVSLTFDDAMNSQLDNAVPILQKHHLNGTFFVTTGLGVWEKRRQEWKHLAEQGSELGNHTVHHPCLLPEIEPHSQDYTPEMMQAEIRDAAKQITQLLHTERGITFAYPCGNMSFGPPPEQVRNAALYIRFVSEYAFAARGAAGGGPQNPEELSVLNVTDLGPTAGQDSSGLLALLAPGIHEHQWGVYCFHGVGGEWLSVNSEALDKLATYLEQHSEIWTATFGDVVRYIQERNATSLQTRQSANSIDIELSWSMDPHMYDLPLTLKIDLPYAWKTATVCADGKNLNVELSRDTTPATFLVNVPPLTKTVHIQVGQFK